MIMAMENAALEAIKPYFDRGESAVGTRVRRRSSILRRRRSGTTWPVAHAARVTRVSGRAIEFRVWATDATKEIGRGTHERAVIDLAKFSARLGE